MRTVLFWVIAQQVVVIAYQHFGATYWSHLQEGTLKMGPVGFPEMLMMNYQYLLCNNPEECSSHSVL
jgi:hypothetical protein